MSLIGYDVEAELVARVWLPLALFVDVGGLVFVR